MDETAAKLVDPLAAANLLGHEGFDPDDVHIISTHTSSRWPTPRSAR
ncbi:hypothetical protein ACFWPK_31805 [Nocardia sp. NPDC058519]